MKNKKTLPELSLALLLYVLLYAVSVAEVRLDRGGALTALEQGHYLEHIHFDVRGAIAVSISVTYSENKCDICGYSHELVLQKSVRPS